MPDEEPEGRSRETTAAPSAPSLQTPAPVEADRPLAGALGAEVAPEHEQPEAFTLSPRVRHILHALMAVLVPAALLYFVWTTWPQLVKGPWHVSVPLLGISVVLYLVSEGMGPLPWFSLMRSAEPDLHIPVRPVYFVWFAVEPTLYLPLPIGPVFGKFALADRAGLPPLVAVVTIAYEYAVSLVVLFAVALPGFLWIGLFVANRYWWVVLLTLLFLLLFGAGMLMPGGLSRIIADMLGSHAHGIEEIQIPRRSLTAPAFLAFAELIVRIFAAGTLFAALTPVAPAMIPVAGLVFASSSAAVFGRFGTREAFIIVGLQALGFAAGPATLVAVASRAMGLACSLVWLGISVAVGGGRRATGKDVHAGNDGAELEVPMEGPATSKE